MINKNPLIEELLDYKYKNEEINKRIYIFKRTKKKRIMKKQFSFIVGLAVAERKVIVAEGVVLMEPTYYDKLIKEKDRLEAEAKELKSQLLDTE